MSLKNKELTREIVFKYLSFNEDTGKFYRGHNGPHAKIEDDGSVYLPPSKGDTFLLCFGEYGINVLNVAWLMHYGNLPDKKYIVIPINGDYCDGRKSNLEYRARGVKCGGSPRKKPREDKLLIGVYRNHKRYMAMIQANGTIYLGTYDTPEEAHEAFKQAHNALMVYGEYLVRLPSGKTRLIVR